jgi:hypothetical protein
MYGTKKNSPHVGWRLDGRHELESSVADADGDDEPARQVFVPSVTKHNGADEDVDCSAGRKVSLFSRQWFSYPLISLKIATWNGRTYIDHGRGTRT